MRIFYLSLLVFVCCGATSLNTTNSSTNTSSLWIDYIPSYARVFSYHQHYTYYDHATRGWYNGIKHWDDGFVYYDIPQPTARPLYIFADLLTPGLMENTVSNESTGPYIHMHERLFPNADRKYGRGCELRDIHQFHDAWRAYHFLTSRFESIKMENIRRYWATILETPELPHFLLPVPEEWLVHFPALDNSPWRLDTPPHPQLPFTWRYFRFYYFLFLWKYRGDIREYRTHVFLTPSGLYYYFEGSRRIYYWSTSAVNTFYFP